MVRLKLIAFSLFFSLPSIAAEIQEDKQLASLNSPVSLATLAETAFGLIIVLGFIVLLAWLIKRTNQLQTSANGKLKIIAGLPLGTRERIVLVEVGKEQILVGVTAQQIQTLHVLKEPINSDDAATPPSQFATKLKHVLSQQDKS
jgi:flagellar protein FliO/FliZ